MESTTPLPPHLPRWPVLGHIPRVRNGGLLQLIDDSWRELGDTFSIDVGFHAVVFAHPEAIKRILAGNAKNYIKGKAYEGVRRVIGNGVLALEGDAWKSRRNLMNPAFHRGSIGRLASSMVETGRAAFDALWTERRNDTSLLDVHRTVVKLTLDVVTVALFGKELLGSADISYEALCSALELVSERGNGLVLPAWVPTPGNRKFHRTMAEVESVIYRVIAKGRTQPADTGTLLSMLIHSLDAETGKPLEDSDLRDEIFTMFIAGHETTALTLTWLFTLLHDRRDVLDRLYAEVDQVVGNRLPTFEDYSKLAYVRQVIDETLRFRGPVAMTARNALADDEVHGVQVKAGDYVLPYFYGAHRHADFWSNPGVFDPGNFGPDRASTRHPWSYLPFSGGQRQCIGNTFSLVETVLLLTLFLQRFEVEVDPSVLGIKPVAMVTVRPDGPVMIRIRPRPNFRAY